ncbi:MAG TPA: hypothetical protein GX504_10065 [Clostridia bacterium]|nr:hypothetical protein [Clostridia bacterium]
MEELLQKILLTGIQGLREDLAALSNRITMTAKGFNEPEGRVERFRLKPAWTGWKGGWTVTRLSFTSSAGRAQGKLDKLNDGLFDLEGVAALHAAEIKKLQDTVWQG